MSCLAGDPDGERHDISYQTVNPYANQVDKKYDVATEQEIDPTIEKATRRFTASAPPGPMTRRRC